MKRASYFTKRFTGSGVRLANEFCPSQQFLRLNQMNRVVHGIDQQRIKSREEVVGEGEEEAVKRPEGKTQHAVERNDRVARFFSKLLLR